MMVPLKVSLSMIAAQRRGFDEFVHQPGGEGVFDAEPFLRCCGREADEQVAFAGAESPIATVASGPRPRTITIAHASVQVCF
jgi:hypothetical protein